jgi:hypothetical protein
MLGEKAFGIVVGIFMYLVFVIFLGVVDGIYPFLSDWTIISISVIVGFGTFIIYLLRNKHI